MLYVLVAPQHGSPRTRVTVAAAMTTLQGYTGLGQSRKVVGLVGYNFLRETEKTMDLLMDNSIWMIFVLVMAVLATRYVRSEMKRLDLTLASYLDAILEFEIKPRLHPLFLRMVGITLMTVTSSVILFGNLWTSDAFHVILLCVLIQSTVKDFVRYILE